MATYIERAQAIGNALINGVATPTQINRLGGALATAAARESEYAAATNSQKAQFLVEELRRRLLSLIKTVEADTSVRDAQAAVEEDVETGFSETP